MKNTPTDPVPLLQDLIRCRSVTPAEGGALTWLENLLSTHGFVCQRLIFREEGTPDVENLFARIGFAPDTGGDGAVTRVERYSIR